MAAPQQLRPLTFYGRVPKGTTNVDICKELVKRFSPNELKCVQDFGAGRFEVAFANMAAVERFLAKSVVTVRNVEVKFEYRGVRVKTVRVLGYPADASDSALLNGLAAYGKVLGVDYEHVPDFKSVLTGNRRLRVEMARPVPNLLPVGSRIDRPVTSGAAESQEAPSKGPEGSPLPEREPVGAEAPGGGEQGRRPELAEASAPSAVLPPLAWRVVRGKKRRARSRDSSRERPAAAARGGPGDLEEGLPGVKRTAATDSDAESTQSTVKGSTVGEKSFSSCPFCSLGSCGGDCSPMSDRVYSSTHEDSSSDEEVGDFNCVLEQVDRVSLKGTPKYRDRKGDLELRELVDELGLVDAWRTLRPDLGGSEWDAVKASVAECFREWGKRRAHEERAEIKIFSDAILLHSKPLSGGPGVTAALTSLRKELRVLLQRRWDRLRATARAEQWEMEAWCSPPVALFAYADDISIVVPDEATVCTVLDVMEGYCSASGARINRFKICVLFTAYPCNNAYVFCVSISNRNA
ncbi:hypothetical protein HPB52_022128 [Rhipicephalus sanguineus]|uniref:Uncharacterized protein n=1 Tax=Rhipicephalus sanguineus TaxID=34632 RepID=A0A9D4PGR4_RHISA|nr:hypothetical protein HPB52_022128 [Rhipicephalus sanguineus]